LHCMAKAHPLPPCFGTSLVLLLPEAHPVFLGPPLRANDRGVAVGPACDKQCASGVLADALGVS
jgi:hypothetical protein